MSENFAAFLYLVSGVLFILALRGLSHPTTSRRGNLFGMVGMAIAILATLLRPTSGTATIAGYDVVTQAGKVRESIGLTGQYAAIDELLTGRENLILFARLRGMDKQAARSRAEEMLAAFSLTEAADKRVATYSGGMRRRLDLAGALVVRPPVVFLDEPTTGLDVEARRHFWQVMGEEADAGRTVIFATHYIEEADSFARRVVLVSGGQLVADGPINEVRASVSGSIVRATLTDPSGLADRKSVV